MKRLFLLLVIIILTSCVSTKTAYHIPIQHTEAPKKLIVFMDGTMNNASSYTNVSKLYNLTILQDKSNVNAAYVTGVGNRGIGLMTGVGIGKTVREAYMFLSKNYHPERHDEIYIFGFSRGAYAARILAGLIHVAGITDLSNIPEKQQYNYIKKVYLAYRGDQTIYNRRKDIKKITGKAPKSVSIEFMGLWDTVEALGVPNFKENYNVPNKNYVDQLCNIKKASQALSINDDRATIFTPKLLSKKYLTEKCEKPVNISKVVNEVWFAGAHSDVGGGYGDTEIDGVALNWMINEIKPYGILPETARVFEDIYGTIHDPSNAFIEIFYRRRFRNISLYVDNNKSYNNGKFKIHKSAIQRLNNPKVLPLQDFEYNLQVHFLNCFQLQENGGFLFIGGDDCIIEEVNQ
ncbi:MAG: DUF2235 domain-containing protein [Flavobacteriaceae bacterium]